MRIPERPPVGHLVAYEYLWQSQAEGREDGAKTYPCAIVLAVDDKGPRPLAYVVALSHSEPRCGQSALEMPAKLKRWLGLDARRSWVYVDEINVFAWPGPDLRPGSTLSALPQARESCVIGRLPDDWFKLLRDRLVGHFHADKVQLLKR